MASFDSTLIARLATGLYNTQIGNATMQEALNAVNGNAYGSVAALADALYARDFATRTDAQVAEMLVSNVGVTGAAEVAEATAIVTSSLAGAAAGHKGTVVVNLLNALAGLTAPAYQSAVTAFNAQVALAVSYAQTAGTADLPLDAPSSTSFNLDSISSVAGLLAMHLTGNQDVRIDITNRANQVIGLDLDGDGRIAQDGVENRITGRAANFEAVDAYSRNPWNQGDTANNFLGDIRFDGVSYGGDGVTTNGNIFLGGLGADTVFSGVGNDFLAGGGVAESRVDAALAAWLAAGNSSATFSGVQDYLSGGRNADFFFAEFSGLDATDGSSLFVDAGNTADDNSAGVGQSPQDSDWLLFEASDDDEPVQIWLNDDNTAFEHDDGIVDGRGRVLSRSGESMLIDDVENVDASGNLYGFLDDLDVEIGGRAKDERDTAGADNYGFGSSAQLQIRGSDVSNIIIGGYDNDFIDGGAGGDLLMGGNLNRLNNPNLIGIVNDGRDELVGGAGSDNIVFETDGGIYEGGSDYDVNDTADDTLWLTANSFGAETAADVTTDGTVRIDLAAGKEGGLGNSAGYGGADEAADTGRYTSDQTNYADGYARAQVQDFESVIATGLGGIDYDPDGDNESNVAHLNPQNFLAFQGDLDLRGTSGVNTLYAADGDDTIEGRQGGTITYDNEGEVLSDGDNRDKLSGGPGSDDFIFALGEDSGDGVDVIHRQTNLDVDGDGDVDNITDGTFGVDFGEEGPVISANSTFTISLPTGSTVNVAGVSFLLNGTVYTINGLASADFPSFTTALNTALDANPALAGLVAVRNADNTITITDPDGGTFAKNPAGGWVVTGSLPADGTSSWSQVVGAPTTTQDQDRLIYAAYEDRNDGELVDDNSTTGSAISLGIDSYAEDLVIDFNGGSTNIAEDQSYVLTFTNLTTEDTVTITVNNVQYTLTVGVDLDGNEIAGEELTTQGGTAASQAAIQDAFLTRMAGFINSFMDDDTAAGEVAAGTTDGFATTLVLTQVDYNGEETVFMRTPTVALSNASGGEPAAVTVTNNSQHEVQLLDFDGRNGKIDAANVLFIGDTGISRAILATGAGAAGTANTMAGSDSIIIDGGANTLQSVIFGTTTAIPNNTATNSFLRTDFTVHGDDLLLGGAANDTITAGTGDDRVLGSLGTDTIDGGKSYYAVQVLGEPQARVYLLNEWEAKNPSKVAAISALTISSINRIGDAEDGNSTPVSVGTAEVYNDTLQFQQSDFVDNTNFTIALTGFTGTTSSTIEFRNGGSGTVTVDAAGNGTVDGTTTFNNFENIRTVSGTQTAVAGGGQGNDTLDIALLSSVAAGVAYDLTNRADVAATATGAGKVTYSANAHASLTRPVEGDFETLVIKVDGVENVITDNASVISGDDLLIIDETEAAKNNTFTAGEGDDRIEYQNQFIGEALDGSAEPRVTIALDNVAASVGGTDTVTMTSGRVGLTQAVDTLNAVEYITLAGNTAEGRVGDVDVVDVLDVRAITTGAVVNYGDGTVKNGGVTHVTIEGIVELETVTANGGNDVVMVADAAVMNTNARSDENNATPNTNILFMTYRDFDDLNTAATTRKSFSAQVTDDTIQNVINQGQFTFNLSAEGGPVDVDRVDYSAELGRIVVPVGQGTATSPQYVVVDGDDDQDFSDAESRVDALLRVEEIVAAKGRSVLDFTAVGQDRQITFQYAGPTGNPANNQSIEQTIRIADGNGNTIAGLNTFVEKYTYNGPQSGATPVAVSRADDATWNQIEGSDARDIIIYNGSEDLVNQAGLDHRYTNDTLTLRGGNNEVRYSPLETSITAAITVTEENLLTTAASEGLISATITFQNGTGAALTGGGTHTITSHTSDNSTAAGNLKIEGSQDAEDSVTFTATGNKTFILGTSPGVVNVNIGTLSSIVLTGFEFLLDPATNDVYDFSSLASTFGLTLTDTGADHDTIKVGNDGIAFNTGTALTINLDAISSNVDGGDADILPGFNFDFDVLDITRVTTSGLTLIGGSDAAPANADTDATDEVVLGALSLVTSITGFEGMVLTQASTAAGTSFTFNPQLNTLTQGSTTVATSADVLSFGGTVLEGTNRTSSVADATTGVTVTVAGTTAAQVYGGAGADTLVGAGGADRLQGNGGNDTYDGGTAAEVRTIQLDGILDGAANAVTINLDGNIYTLNEVAALVDVDADAGDNLDIIQGAGSDAVGAALAQLVTANLDEINLTAAFGGTDLLTVTYNSTSDLLTFTFATAVDVLATDTIVVADTDGGSFAASSESVVTEGGSGGIDTFVFGSSLATNGQDTINNFVALGGAVDDVLDFQAFLGGVVGGSVGFGVYDTVTSWTPDNLQMAVFANKASLAAADFALTATAGKLRMADGEKAVIVVTADVDGVSDAVNQAYSVYFVSNPATVTGLGDLTIELVGTIGSAVEMNLVDFASAGTAT